MISSCPICNSKSITVACFNLLSDYVNSHTAAAEPVNLLNEDGPAAPKQAVVEVDLASEAEKQKKRAERFGIPASLEVSVMKSFVKNWW